MDSGFLAGLFNSAAASIGGIAALAVGAFALWRAGPKMQTVDSTKAYIITGYKFPISKKAQFVVRGAPQAYYRFGSSSPEEVPLQSFTVTVRRTGIRKGEGLVEEARDRLNGEKDESLTLADKIKAEVDVDFYVQVDTDDVLSKDQYAPDEVDSDGKVIKKGELIKKGGEIISTGDQNIIKAKKTLGTIDEKTIAKYLLPKADSALRAAAAQMTIDQIQSDREAFLEKVKQNISLADHGLKVTDAALRDFRQAPKESFNPNDYFDAQGLKLVTEKANASLQAVNESNQITQTLIARKTQEQTIERLTITQTQKQAELTQQQQIAQMTAEQAKRVAEIEADNSKQANIAKIVADQETKQRDIEKERQIAIANADKDKQSKVAQEQAEQAAATARIMKEKTVEIANRDKEVALQAKAAEVAQAQQAANLKRAEAVTAEQSVLTAEEVAKAERLKQVAVIESKKEAEKVAEGKKIEAAASVVIAENQATAVRERAKGEADAALTKATGESAAAQKRAEGSYAETFQPLKAKADGDLAQAAAEEALNKARNALNEQAREYLVNMKRTEITPEVVQAFVAAMASIDNFNVTSINGAPSFGGNAGVGGGAGGSTNVFEQFYAASRQNMLTAPLLKRIITDMGGDPKMVDNLPGIAAAPAPVVPVDAELPSPEAIDAQTRSISAKASGPKPKP